MPMIARFMAPPAIHACESLKQAASTATSVSIVLW